MHSSKPLLQPMAVKSMVTNNANLCSHPTHYLRIVGVLQYLIITRQDLSYAISTICVNTCINLLWDIINLSSIFFVVPMELSHLACVFLLKVPWIFRPSWTLIGLDVLSLNGPTWFYMFLELIISLRAARNDTVAHFI